MEYVPEGTPEPGPLYLEPTEFFDFDRPNVAAFAARAAEGAADETDLAVRLYYAVRDSIRYDPYAIRLERDLYKASNVLEAQRGFCLPKANLLIASLRARGIPAGIGLSNVRNHLSTEKLHRTMGGKDLFLNHGYAVLYVNGRWVKAAPSFNIELCDRFGVPATEFDGAADALLQQYDSEGRHFMDYTRDHGIWSDFPFDRIMSDFRSFYPETLWNPPPEENAAVFEREQPLA